MGHDSFENRRISETTIVPYSCRPRHPRSDTRCPDGFPCYGWRQVHKGGYVSWYGGKYYHAELKSIEGLWVYVTIADWLAIEVEVWTTAPWEGETLIAKMPDERPTIPVGKIWTHDDALEK